VKVTLEMGPSFNRVAAELGSMGSALKAACSAGLEKGVKIAAGNVIGNHLTGQSLKRRTGNLARAVDGWLESDTDGVVGVGEGTAVDRYAWLLGDEDKTITPKKAKFLTIPIGEGLTPSGVARYKSPREVEGGFFIRSKTALRGKKGKFRPLFVLVKSVRVKGSGALYEGVTESMDDISLEIENEIDRQLGAG